MVCSKGQESWVQWLNSTGGLNSGVHVSSVAIQTETPRSTDLVSGQVYPPQCPHRLSPFPRRCSGRSSLVIMSKEKKFSAMIQQQLGSLANMYDPLGSGY